MNNWEKIKCKMRYQISLEGFLLRTDNLRGTRIKQIISLYIDEEKTYEEIGQIFSISKSRVGCLIADAISSIHLPQFQNIEYHLFPLLTGRIMNDPISEPILKTAQFSMKVWDLLEGYFPNVYNGTIRDLLKLSKKELLKIRSIGHKSVNEIIDFLDQYNLKLVD